MTKPVGAIACGHAVTAAAAREALQAGGNAFDAVTAAHAAACVAEPVLASLGGGGFLLAHPADGDPVIYDFFVQTPIERGDLERLEFYPVEVDFGGVSQEFHIGIGATATPGAVCGLFEIHQDLCRLPLAQLLRPAIAAAREGVAITPLQRYMMHVIAPIYTATAEAKRVYAGGGDTMPEAGDVLRQPALADTFEALLAEGPALFHRGELAKGIVAACEEHGGQLGAADLAGYRVERRRPLAVRYRDAAVHTNPPPSTGGALIAFALRHMEAADGTAGPPSDEATRMVRVGRAMQAANVARGEMALGELLNVGLTDGQTAAAGETLRFSRGTTHISVIDGEGNRAAMTLSNGEGCGRLVPGTGVMLNNMLGEADLSPDGWHCWRPDTRVASMMAPTLLTIGERRFALGSGGSNRIRSAILQTIERLTDGMAVQDAVGAPRIHMEGDLLSIEGGVSPPADEALAAAFPNVERWPDKNLFFGGVHVAGVRQDAAGKREFVAVGDARRGGEGVALS